MISLWAGRASLDASISAMSPTAWYDVAPGRVFTDTSRTTAANVGDAVAAVADRSGNSLHVTQSTSGARPILRQTAGGLYYLEWDGTDDYLSGGSNVASLAITGDLTLATSVRCDSGAFPMFITYQTGAGNLNAYEFRQSTAGGVTQFVHGDASVETLTGPAVPAAGTDFFASVVRGSSSSMRVNSTSVSVTPTKTPTTDASSEFRLGSRHASATFYAGRMYGAMVFNRAVTTAEHAVIATYLGAKAGLSL